jgi:hypothetical protein
MTYITSISCVVYALVRHVLAIQGMKSWGDHFADVLIRANSFSVIKKYAIRNSNRLDLVIRLGLPSHAR